MSAFKLFSNIPIAFIHRARSHRCVTVKQLSADCPIHLWTLVAGLYIAGLGEMALASEQEIGVEGQCASVSKDVLGRVRSSTSTAFRIVVRTNGWELRFKTDGRTEDYLQVSSERTNTYYLAPIRSIIEEKRAHGERTGENVAGGVVLKRLVPNAATYDPAGPIWLTFASGEYFRNRVSNEGRIDVPCGVWTDGGLDVELVSVFKPAKWTVNAETGIPSELTIFETPDAHTRYMPNGGYRSFRWPKPYDQGFTNSVFRVEAEREFNGLNWPQRSIYQVFWTKSDGGNSNDLWIRMEYSILATNYFQPQEALEFPPNVPGLTAVNDARFFEAPDSKRPFVIMTDTRFGTDAEARKAKGYLFGKLQPKPFDLDRRGALTKRVFYITVIVLVLLPLPVFLKSRLRSKSEAIGK